MSTNSVKPKGNTNRTKGHNAERFYAKFFKELGFPLCVTARYGSRQHDDAGIDLINLPFNVQIKAGSQKAMKPGVELQYVHDRVRELFPKNSLEIDKPVILIHKKEVGPGKKRTQFDELVHMSFEDFTKLLKMIKWE